MTRECQSCKASFEILEEDMQFYGRIKVPPPTFCPDCRFQRRLLFRNERSLYRRECALCGKGILSVFSTHAPFPNYCYECWWSDQWDPFAYGQDYDFSKTFFEQYRALTDRVPVINKWGFDNVNCDYATYLGYSKNVYLSSSVVRSEDIYFSYSVDNGRSIFDSFISGESEFCYENINCQKAYNSSFLVDCRNCIDSHFLYDCAGCQNCFMSSGLRNKRFYIRNRPYTEEGYHEELRNIGFGSYAEREKLLAEFRELRLSALHKYADIVASRNCTGDNIHHSKNAKRSFLIGNSENVRYCWRLPTGFKDAYDITGALDSELVYEGVAAADHNYLVRFYMQCRSSKNLNYCMHCSFCNDLFGCVGLRKKQYCILNRQYAKEEYEKLVPRIIAHMNTQPYTDRKGRVYRYGEFFPPDLLSPFTYNETVAQEYHPLTREEALRQGYTWGDHDPKQYTITIYPDPAPEGQGSPPERRRLPDHIREVDDLILRETVGCLTSSDVRRGRSRSLDPQASGCTTAFKIVPEELQFYRRMNLPLPRLCPNCRHYERLAQRNPLKLWHRRCQCAGTGSESGAYQNTATHPHGDQPCPNEFQTSYSPERPEIVYCESCYNAEVA